MKCPSCDEHIILEDYNDTEPFHCEYCDELLALDIDEGTYFGAQHRTLRIVNEDEE